MTTAEQPVIRCGRVSWLTGPPAGTARVDVVRGAVGEARLVAVPVVLAPDEAAPGVVAAGELLAVAYAVFMAAALAEELLAAGAPAQELVVEAACSFANELPERSMDALELTVQGRVPGLEEAAFHRLATTARHRAIRSAGGRSDLPGKLHVELQPAG